MWNNCTKLKIDAPLWGNMDWRWDGGWPILGGMHMILWWVFLIIGIVVLFKVLTKSSSRDLRNNGDRALKILKERYARGEIGKDEFQQKKRDLQT